MSPTGYTAPVADGKITDFPTFALECARAFGALVTLRDDPKAPIPDEFQPSPYYDEKAAGMEAELDALLKLTPEEAQARAQAEYEADQQRAREYDERNAAQRARYEAMLVEARAWTPPTPDHEELKAFMVQQLEESIEFDCRPLHRELRGPLDGVEWLKISVGVCRRMLADTREHANEEALRAKRRTEWVRQLRASLAREATP